MKPTQPASAAVKPLFGHTELFALGEPGGVVYAMEHTPGPLRPFVATLAVPTPPTMKRHDTPDTSPATAKETERSHDGRVVPDRLHDRGQDS
ncbi:MAG: hypothetical protein ACRDXX_05925 [Stackebrandtia sp.]